MTERRCINCNDLMAEGDATVLYADAKPVAWVHPTCLEDYTTGASDSADAEAAFTRLMEVSDTLLAQRKALRTK